MNFEQALVVEFNTITELENKVFPLYATEGIKPPFLIYISSEGEKVQTLDGFTLSKEIKCELHVLAYSYSQMKDLSRKVMIHVQNLLGRQIGNSEVKIKSLSYDQPEEVYEEEVKYYRSSFEVRFKI